jgi:hypothetical protein
LGIIFNILFLFFEFIFY